MWLLCLSGIFADDLYLKISDPEQVETSNEYALVSQNKRAMMAFDGSKIGYVGTATNWIGDDDGIVIPYYEKQQPSLLNLIKAGNYYVIHFKGTEYCLGASGSKNSAKLITITYSDDIVDDTRALWQLVPHDGEMSLQSVKVGYHLVYSNSTFKVAAKTSNSQYVNLFQKIGEGIRMPSSGYVTYVAMNPTDFTQTPGMQACKVMAATKSRVNIIPIEKAPKNTAVVLHGKKGCYPIYETSESVEPVSGNLLRASDGSVSHRSDGMNYYTLEDKITYGPGFYRVEKDNIVAERTAYLIIQGDDRDAEFISIVEGPPTGIETMNTKMLHERTYDLMGRTASSGKLPQRIVVKSGKKYVQN